MNTFFRRQLTRYAQYHCSSENCVLHWLGVPAIFFAVLVFLAVLQVSIGGISIAIGTLLLIPAVTLWVALDVGVGSALVVTIIPLAAGAEWLGRSAGVTLVLLIGSALFVTGWLSLVVGHAVFEGRKPAFIDDLSLMFIGPMFLVAKALVALGLRPDLAGCFGAPHARQTQSNGRGIRKSVG
jgi:uncharacterized membrane protein YGL010W